MPTRSSRSLRIPKRRAGPIVTGRSTMLGRPSPRCVALTYAVGGSIRTGCPLESVSQLTIRSSVGSGVRALISRRASCPLISSNSTPGSVRLSSKARRDLSPLPGEDQLPPGETPVGRSNGESLQFQHGLSGEHQAWCFERPGVTLVPRAPDLVFAQNPPFDGLTAQEDPEGALFAEKGFSGRTRVPEHQVIHFSAASEFGGGQCGTKPQTHHRHPLHAEVADVVNCFADAAEPLLSQVRIGPGARGVSYARIVHSKRHPARPRQPMCEVPQRARRICAFQSHGGAEHHGADDEPVLGKVQPGKMRPVRCPQPKRNGLDAVAGRGLSHLASAPLSCRADVPRHVHRSWGGRRRATTRRPGVWRDRRHHHMPANSSCPPFRPSRLQPRSGRYCRPDPSVTWSLPTQDLPGLHILRRRDLALARSTAPKSATEPVFLRRNHMSRRRLVAMGRLPFMVCGSIVLLV